MQIKLITNICIYPAELEGFIVRYIKVNICINECLFFLNKLPDFLILWKEYVNTSITEIKLNRIFSIHLKQKNLLV